LWVRDDIRWGSAQEKGLSAGFFLFLASGVGTDWWLRSKYGENPDQKWDSYLAQYIANLPTESDRAGIFHPLVSMWSKTPFRYRRSESTTPSEVSLEKDNQCLFKGKTVKWVGNDRVVKTKTRGDIKFRPLDNDKSTGLEARVARVCMGDVPHFDPRPWFAGAGSAASTQSSTLTPLEDVVHSGIDGEKVLYPASIQTRLLTEFQGPDLSDYSDHAMGVTPDVNLAKRDRDWTRKPQTDDLHTTSQPYDFVLDAGRRGPQQRDSRDSSERHENPRWQAFWRDVNERIQHKSAS